MRYLTWFVAEAVGPGADQGESYVLDGAYEPVRAWVHLKAAPNGSPLILDLNVDGESIFALRPTVQRAETFVEEDAFASVQFSRGSVITFDVDQAGSGERGMTVCLELADA